MGTFTQISQPLHRLFISLGKNEFMRCDLHVHSIASGMCNTPGLDKLCRESYNDPVEVYARLKQRGMAIVTLTDHDSIDAAEALRSKPDFYISEEVTVKLPTGTEMHMGVYGITERDHISAVPGRYGWDGGLGTSWYSDPREEMVIILMTQCAWASPSPPNVYFWTLAYQAIDD